MDITADVTARLESAQDLTGIVSAAHHAFAFMLPLIKGQQDLDSAVFCDFVMAGMYAANGRDALVFAPALRPAARRRVSAGDPLPALKAATMLGRLSSLVAERLTEAAKLAAGEADRRACTEARRQAHRLVALFTRLIGP